MQSAVWHFVGQSQSLDGLHPLQRFSQQSFPGQKTGGMPFLRLQLRTPPSLGERASSSLCRFYGERSTASLGLLSGNSHWRHAYFPPLIGVLLATAFELWAVYVVKRWEYGLMPIVPVVRMGVTPMLQMIFVPVATLLASQSEKQFSYRTFWKRR